MDSRTRVRTALSHRQPDRVPLDFSGHRSSGISAIAYAGLRDYLGLEKRPVRVYDPVQQLAVVDDDILDALGVDTVELGRAWDDEDIWREWTLPDGTACLMPRWAAAEREGDSWVIRSSSGRPIAVMPDDALYFEQSFYPLAEGFAEDDLDRANEESMWAVVASPPGPLAGGKDGRRKLREHAKNLRESTDRAIVALFGGNLVEAGQSLYRHDNFFMMLAAEPERTHAFLDRLVATHLENLERFMEDVGELVDVVMFGDDMGTQNGPQFSPEMYREFFRDRHAKMWRRAKRDHDVSVMLHCCGGVRELLPDMIEAGLDAINPVQTSCAGMDPAGLKRDFGDQLTLWGGGCDTREVLPSATPAEVREHVLRRLEIMAPGGGFVFQQVHNILADAPPENTVAMFEAVREYNSLPAAFG